MLFLSLHVVTPLPTSVRYVVINVKLGSQLSLPRTQVTFFPRYKSASWGQFHQRFT